MTMLLLFSLNTRFAPCDCITAINSLSSCPSREIAKANASNHPDPRKAENLSDLLKIAKTHCDREC